VNYRNEQLTRLAANNPCMFALPGICNQRVDTTVWCHSNESRHGKGKGLKANDCFGAFGCYPCHTWYDQGTASRAEKEAAFRIAFERTLLHLWSHGMIHVRIGLPALSSPADRVKRNSVTARPAKMLPRRI
jgi:hypothetical protein